MSGLANRPGVCGGLPRTQEGVQKALRRYEEANRDLDPRTRRIMALGAVSGYFKRRLIEAATDERLPAAIMRDWSWRWWNVLVLSGLEEHWQGFKDIAEVYHLRQAAAWLRQRVTPQQYRLFLRRAGTNPHNSHHRHSGRNVWTKAGTWDARGSFTKLLVLQQHLPKRQLVLPWQRKLGHAAIEQIEKELFRLLDPDKVFPHIARERAVGWVQARIGELLGYKQRRASIKCVAWFFGCPIPDGQGGVVAPDTYRPYLIREYMGKTYKYIAKTWEW